MGWLNGFLRGGKLDRALGKGVAKTDCCFRYEYTGRTEEESLGNTWRAAFHPDDTMVADKLWDHSIKTGEPYSTEYRCRNKEGKYRWMLARALPLRNMHTGAIERWFGTCTDIQETVETRSAAKRLVRTLLIRVGVAANLSSANNSYML